MSPELMQQRLLENQYAIMSALAEIMLAVTSPRMNTRADELYRALVRERAATEGVLADIRAATAEALRRAQRSGQ